MATTTRKSTRAAQPAKATATAKAAPAKAPAKATPAKAAKRYTKGEAVNGLGVVVWATNAWTLFKKPAKDGGMVWTAVMADGTRFTGDTSAEVAGLARDHGRSTGAIATREAKATKAPAKVPAPRKANGNGATKATAKATTQVAVAKGAARAAAAKKAPAKRTAK